MMVPHPGMPPRGPPPGPHPPPVVQRLQGQPGQPAPLTHQMPGLQLPAPPTLAGLTPTTGEVLPTPATSQVLAAFQSRY